LLQHGDVGEREGLVGGASNRERERRRWILVGARLVRERERLEQRKRRGCNDARPRVLDLIAQLEVFQALQDLRVPKRGLARDERGIEAEHREALELRELLHALYE